MRINQPHLWSRDSNDGLFLSNVQATVITYPQKLLTLAGRLIDEGEFGIAIVVAHMACEIATERSLSEAFVAKGISVFGRFSDGVFQRI
jgi:hypothetical protein